jgi:hypothetical protein
MFCLLSSWVVGNWRTAPARRSGAGFRKFSGKNSCIARLLRARADLKGPRPDPWPDLTMTGRCKLSSSVGSSKNTIRTSLLYKHGYKATLALCRNEVRILIFDDPAEIESLQCPEFCFAQLDSMFLRTSTAVVQLYCVLVDCSFDSWKHCMEAAAASDDVSVTIKHHPEAWKLLLNLAVPLYT